MLIDSASGMGASSFLGGGSFSTFSTVCMPFTALIFSNGTEFFSEFCSGWSSFLVR